MTHTGPMAEHEGKLSRPRITGRLCAICRAPMTVQSWESSCGGYEDDKFTCTRDPLHVEWVDGPDA